MNETAAKSISSWSRFATLAWLAVAALVVFADIETKQWASQAMDLTGHQLAQPDAGAQLRRGLQFSQ
jgi:hypothetical protein